MGIDADHGNRITLSYEGVILQNAAAHGPDDAAAMACCMADGAVNAIMRLQGREVAAGYVFKLEDRVMQGIRLPTIPLLPEALMPRPEGPSAPNPPQPLLRAYVWLQARGWIG